MMKDSPAFAAELARRLNCFTDLHLHLDGSLSMASARELGAMQNIPVPEDDAELSSLLQVSEDCTSLTEFLEKFAFPCSLLQTRETLAKAAENLLNELADGGLMYAEIRFAPQLHLEQGLTQEDAVEAVLEGMQKAGLPSGLILCCMRGSDNSAQNLETLNLAAKFLGRGVCGLDLAGDEFHFPTRDFRDLFLAAGSAAENAAVPATENAAGSAAVPAAENAAGGAAVPVTIHAGEAAGPESIRDALSMGAVRIGHGVRAAEDPELCSLLAARQIPLELCPTSNLQTGIFSSVDEFPLNTLRSRGIQCTINTDDMAVCHTDIRNEYLKLIRAFGLRAEDLRELLHGSVSASFADEDLKVSLHRRIDTEFDAAAGPEGLAPMKAPIEAPIEAAKAASPAAPVAPRLDGAEEPASPASPVAPKAPEHDEPEKPASPVAPKAPEPDGPEKPASPVAASVCGSPARFLLGVDVGGTTVKTGLYDCSEISKGRILLIDQAEIPTRTENNGSQILPDIAQAVRGMAASNVVPISEIAGAGFGVPGPVIRGASGEPLVNRCVNLGWGVKDIPAEFSALTGIRRVSVLNDANAAALGEMYCKSASAAEDGTGSIFSVRENAGLEADSAVFITFGTGIGAGLVLNGQIAAGAFGAAGEIGHMPVRPGHPLMQKLLLSGSEIPPAADLEFYVSGRGIGSFTQTVMTAFAQGKLSDGAAASTVLSETSTARELFSAAKAGDSLALEITDFFFDTIGAAFASVSAVLDPELYIIGGGVAKAGDFLLDGMRESFRRHAFHASREARFRLASLGSEAGMAGTVIPLLAR